MKKLLCIMAVCLFFACSSENENQEIAHLSEQTLKADYDRANQEMNNYISEITRDAERRKNFVAEVNQKPGDKDWQLECFRKHYQELSSLMENVKEADLKLHSLKHEEENTNKVNH